MKPLTCSFKTLLARNELPLTIRMAEMSSVQAALRVRLCPWADRALVQGTHPAQASSEDSWADPVRSGSCRLVSGQRRLQTRPSRSKWGPGQGGGQERGLNPGVELTSIPSWALRTKDGPSLSS